MATKQEIIDRLSQCGDLSYQDWIVFLDSIFFDGEIEEVYVEVNTSVLPIPSGEFDKMSIVFSGTYTQPNGSDIVVDENSIAILSFDATSKVWSLTDQKTFPKNYYSYNEYVTHFLVDTAFAPTTRINSVDVTDPIQKKILIKKLDQCFKSIKAFGLKYDEFLLIRQFTFNPETKVISIGLSVVTNEKEMQDINALPVAFYSETIQDVSKIFTLKLTQQYTERCYFLTMDVAPFATENISFNFRNAQQLASFQTAGIRNTSIVYLPKKDIWGSGYSFITGGSGTSWQYPRPYYFHNAVKYINVTSEVKSLVRISGISYNTTSNNLVVVIMTCLDDDPQNNEVTTTRNGFAYLRINIPITDTGLKRYESYVLSGSSTVKLMMIVDCTYLFTNVPDIPLNGFAISNSSNLAHWFVNANSSGGGSILNSLLLIDGQDDFEGNFRFAPSSGNWVISDTHNLTKITRIPEGTESVDFNMSFDGANSNAMWLDKEGKFISWVYNGSDGTISFLNAIPPANARFTRASTITTTSTAKITAKGLFEINDNVKQYRSINEGLADKYSGLYFEVNGFVYKKQKEGICLLNEYSSTGGGWLDSIPEFEKDGSYVIPSGIVHTNGINTYTGGTLCAVKDGVMYFYNAKDCAIFKSEDDGQSFTTIVDKYSHPGVWDLQDVNTESRSAIVVLDNGELLFPVRHRGTVQIPDSSRFERFYVLYRTTNGQTDLERCLTFSHEDNAKTWLPTSDPQYGWPNHSGGCMLGDFTHTVDGNMVVITEYGAGTPKYWLTQTPPVANNARGVSGRAWVSFDYGVTWKKWFDADRKISGLEEADDNWYYFTSTYSAKMRHMHGVDFDPIRRTIQLTNGDNEDYIWSIDVDSLRTWYDSAQSVDPLEKPEYKLSDTFPNIDAKLIVPSGANTNNIYSSMRGQMMKSISGERGLVWGHDASREFAFLSYYNNGEFVFEPVFQFELESDFDTFNAFVNSWSSTDGFVQGLTKHNGIMYFTHSNGGTRPSRIWASIDGISWKIVFEGNNSDIKFAGKLLFDRNKIYLQDGTNGQASNLTGYFKLKIKE